MQDSKFNFSRDEINLMKNQDFFKQKSIITQKITSLFQELNTDIEKIKKEHSSLPVAANRISGKISKGENYLGLPYLVLDNPRVFSKQNVFAFRSMFWWGNYFSFTFHISGTYLEGYKKNIYRNFDLLKKKDFLICTHSQQWIHHLEKENYKNLTNTGNQRIKNLVDENGFLKLSRKLELKKWNDVGTFGIETLKEYFSLLES